MGSEAFPGEEDALMRSWLGGLMFRGLCLPAGLTVEQTALEREGARAAAAELAGDLGGDLAGEGQAEGAGLEARVQAAQFVAAHAAAMDWQAEANRRDLPPHARATAQRLARQLMALTTSQLHALCRLRAERRKDREQAARLADREALAAARAATDLTACDDPAAITDPDLVSLADLALAIATPPPGIETPGAASPAPPRPEAAGAGPGSAGGFAEASVPEPPPDPAPPLNRQQRRALERLRRRETRTGAERGGKGIGVGVG